MNIVVAYIVETLKRFGSKNPKYFKSLQIIAGLLVALALVVIYVLPRFVIVSELWIEVAGHVIEVSVAAGLVAQLPKLDAATK